VGPTGVLKVSEKDNNRFPLPGLEVRTVHPAVFYGISKKTKVNTSRMRREIVDVRLHAFQITHYNAWS
jgi:hypothetical protein